MGTKLLFQFTKFYMDPKFMKTKKDISEEFCKPFKDILREISIKLSYINQVNLLLGVKIDLAAINYHIPTGCSIMYPISSFHFHHLTSKTSNPYLRKKFYKYK